MPYIKVKVPDGALNSGLSAPRVVKNLLAKALDETVAIKGSDSISGGVTATLYISDAMNKQLVAAAERDGVDPPVWASVAVAVTQRKKDTESRGKHAPQLAKPWMRNEQSDIYTYVVDALNKNEIVMAQAGTGVGKTRAFLAVAADAVKEGKTCVFASPSIQVLSHTAEEMSLCAKDVDNVAPLFLLGAGQFVSERRLVSYLSDSPLPASETLALMDWIHQGGKPSSESSVRISKWQRVSFLLEDVVKIAPSMGKSDIDAVSLSADEGTAEDASYDRGAAAYREAMQGVEDANLIVCTHAMLGCHLLSKRRNPDTFGILGDFDYIFVDEAHLLEGNIAQAMTQKISLHMLKIRLRQMAAPSAVRKACRSVEDLDQICRQWLDDMQLQSLIAFYDGDEYRLGALKESARQVHQFVKNSVRRNVKKDSAGLRLMRRDMNTLSTLCNPKTPAYMSCTSHEKQWRVSVGVGPASIRKDLSEMFQGVAGGALFSASLAVPDAMGMWNYSYMQTMLGVPSHRSNNMPPIAQSWAYETPRLYMTNASGLVRPRDEIDESQGNGALDAFYDRVAGVISEKVLPTAKGGTLILCTGYKMVSRISKSLLAANPDRLFIIQERHGKSGHALREYFVGSARKGLRPVWIATGTAWTGMDLRDSSVSDSKAENDVVLTDLVIPCVQTSLSNTSTYAARSRKGVRMNTLSAETFFATMQGMGRLMRRPGVTGRKMWILDARLWNDLDKSRKWLNPIRKYIEKFPNREFI